MFQTVDISWFYNSEPDYGFTNPATLNVTIGGYYNKDLDEKGLYSLYRVLTHESIHRTRPRSDMIERPKNHPDICRS